MAQELYPPHLVELYDYWYPDLLGELPQLSVFLKQRAPGTRVMEYGVGTGRIALPLAESGLEVTGLDSSGPMLSRLAERDPDQRIRVVTADFVHDQVDGEHDAVLLMVNTLFVARSLDEQIAVFTHAAANLADEGVFLVETFNAQHYHGLTSPQLTMRPLTPEITLFEQYVVDPAQQLMISTNRVVGPEHNFFFTHVLRYMFLSEMDAVARVAGLTLRERCSDYAGTPFAAGSPRALSVYGKQS